MTTNDIISHRLGATDFYKRLHATTLGAACKEPLKINDLVKMSTRVMIPTGHLVDYGTAVCFACIQSLLDKYQRRVKPDAFAIEYMAEQMTKRYSHWSVLDLPTFVNMTIMARLPSMKYGEQEYELLNLDIPSIMGKTEVYDKMRPPESLAPFQSTSSDERAFTAWQQTHLLDGTEWDFSIPYPGYEDQGYAMTNALAYWREEGFKQDERDKAAIDDIVRRIQSACKHLTIN